MSARILSSILLSLTLTDVYAHRFRPTLSPKKCCTPSGRNVCTTGLHNRRLEVTNRSPLSLRVPKWYRGKLARSTFVASSATCPEEAAEA